MMVVVVGGKGVILYIMAFVKRNETRAKIKLKKIERNEVYVTINRKRGTESGKWLGETSVLLSAYFYSREIFVSRRYDFAEFKRRLFVRFFFIISRRTFRVNDRSQPARGAASAQRRLGDGDAVDRKFPRASRARGGFIFFLVSFLHSGPYLAVRPSVRRTKSPARARHVRAPDVASKTRTDDQIS